MISLSVKRLVILTILVLAIKQSTVVKKLLAFYRWKKLKMIETVPCPSEFERAKHAFIRNFLEGREKGSQMTLTVDGKIVFDVRAGRDDNTVFNGEVMVFSSSKVIESLVVAMLVDRQKLAYEDPIAKYWPAFGERFSRGITVAQLMAHQAGLEQIHQTITTPEAQQALASAENLEKFIFSHLQMDEDVKQGETHARYHAVTRGIIVDLLCYKVDGRRGRDFIQQEIVGKLDPTVRFAIGRPLNEQDQIEETESSMSVAQSALELIMHKLGIVEAFYAPGPFASDEELEAHHRDFLLPEEVYTTMAVIDRNSRTHKSLILVNDHKLGTHHLADSPEFRALPLMSVTGISNSRSLALILTEVACGGGKFLSPAGLAKALEHDKPVLDELFRRAITFTKSGWSSDRLGEEWVGWGGSGGSVTVFSPKFRAAFSYVPSLLDGRAYKPNGMRILKEVTKVLSGAPKAYL